MGGGGGVSGDGGLRLQLQQSLIYFSYFSQQPGFDMSCKLSPHVKSCFLGKIRKKIFQNFVY